MQIRRKSVEEESDCLVDGGRGDQVIVVQDEEDRRFEIGAIVEQGRDDDFRRWGSGRLQESDCTLAQSRLNRVERGNEISEEAGGVVIVSVKRQPGWFRQPLLGHSG